MANTVDKDRIKANAARIKREGYTPVVPDMQMGFIHNNVDCIGCRVCEIACKDKNGLEAACPFGAPQLDTDENVVKKCNMCVDEQEAGRKPYCVAACMMRVLDVGPIDQIDTGGFRNHCCWSQ
ncbi:4Fe-4S dicluster domain-containing protein [Profundibacter sp.]